MKKTKVQEIIERSGNSFHSRVANALRDTGWSVLVSPYYNDAFSDKPREIDLIAEKKFDVYDFPNQWIGTVNARLFVECKYVNGDTVFWFEAKDKKRATERAVRDTGLRPPEENTTIQGHHYLADVPVAKLFESDKSRDGREIINTAINQVLNGTVYYRNYGGIKIIETPHGHAERVLKRVHYPLIVVNSFEKFHATAMQGDGSAQPITDPFQLEVNYAYPGEEGGTYNEYFLIDVVSIDKLADFLVTAIEKADVSVVREKLFWDRRMNGSRTRTQQGPDDPFW